MISDIVLLLKKKKKKQFEIVKTQAAYCVKDFNQV